MSRESVLADLGFATVIAEINGSPFVALKPATAAELLEILNEETEQIEEQEKTKEAENI